MLAPYFCWIKYNQTCFVVNNEVFIMLSIDRVWEWDYCLVQDFFNLVGNPRNFWRAQKRHKSNPQGTAESNSNLLNKLGKNTKNHRYTGQKQARRPHLFIAVFQSPMAVNYCAKLKVKV